MDALCKHDWQKQQFSEGFASEAKGRAFLASSQAFVHEAREGGKGKGHTEGVMTPFNRKLN